MKIHVPGDTPMDRLINLTKWVIAVPKSEIDEQAKQYDQKKRRRLRRKRARAVRAVLLAALTIPIQQSNPVYAQSGQFAVYGPVQVSCGTFTAATGARRQSLEWWAFGFVSGADSERSNLEPRLAQTDTGGVRAWITQYCADHPLEEFVTAPLALVDELAAKSR